MTRADLKVPLVMMRTRTSVRDLRAGCFVCHGDRAHWTSANAQALAAQHHDRTGHPTWCDIAITIRYGRTAPDDRQTDIEDAIASASTPPSSGGEPKAAPLPVPDAPAIPLAGVSAPLSRPSRHDSSRPCRRGARGQKPETMHA